MPAESMIEFDTNDMITVAEAAQLLGNVAHRTVGEYYRQGLFQRYKFNSRRILYSRKSILEYLHFVNHTSQKEQLELFS